MNRRALTLLLALALLVAAFTMAAVAGAATSATDTVVAATGVPTALTVDPVPTFPYWKNVTLSGRLVSVEASPTGTVGLGARGVVIEASNDGGQTWTAVQWLTTRFDGTWVYIYNPARAFERNHWVRARYAGEPGVYLASTGNAQVAVTLWLGQPTKNIGRVKVGTVFRLTCDVKPRFSAGIDVARAQFYLRGTNGAYTLVKTVRMSSRYLSKSVTRLQHSTSLPAAGRYRVRINYTGTVAAYGGSLFAPSLSPYYYFTVK